MTSILYIGNEIETKKFFLPKIINNGKIKKNKHLVRIQKHECGSYFGEEIKDPVFKNNIFSIEKIKVPRSFTTKQITKISQISNIKLPIKLESIKPVKLFDFSSKKVNFKPKINNSFVKKKKKSVNLKNFDFPYSKPKVNNSYSKIMSRQAKREAYLLSTFKNSNQRKITY